MTIQFIKVPVKGIDCADCVKHVYEAITALPRVTSASVLLSLERAIIQLDPQRVDLPMIAKPVTGAGYSVPETITDAPPSARTFGDTSRPVLTIFGIVVVSCFS